MNLLVDVGNSRIKWALAAGAVLRERGAMSYAGQALESVLAEAWGTLGRPDAVAGVNVAGRAVARGLADWTQAHFGVAPRWIEAVREGCGVYNAYGEPDRLGADRWAALIGARRRSTDAVGVVDCGTAITIDGLGADGRHQGGLIAPGVLTMRQALYGATAGIADEGEGGLAPAATDTRSAVTAGTLYAAAAFIDRACDEMERRLGPKLVCLLTGGDADRLRGLLRRSYVAVPDLVLEGLAVIVAEKPVIAEIGGG